MSQLLLDGFADLSGWIPVASGLARLQLSSDAGPHGRAMRLDFDFGGGGFVIARKEVSLALRETWALGFSLRGSGPPNRLEVKLADPGGENVWWYSEAFALPADWQPMRIRSSRLEFAWGPAGGGAMSRVAPSRSRSPPGRGDAARSGSPISPSRTARWAPRRSCAPRAPRPDTARGNRGGNAQGPRTTDFG